ncbi:mitochondrial import inner membrane translocasesubunit [Lichtheimia corymbifera JMRC:FSU:9682]|uniref:Mitochondrial import inner membrane translocasesubunit n=1 Tax=Lichtheimia corymbifera JMRC:FSU:9682 TaxID=1263082 RepID=A0A068RNT3_9FUNG|nr:mitochondrial import inner membrane translocasesubunit [Lichtheimia corymbifera JMRC:FSU:9682]
MSYRTYDYVNDPCPWGILYNAGGAFALGSICSALWHSIKGAYSSVKGQRLAGAVSAANARAPVTGGQFAAWAALLRTFECGIEGIRQKQDPWNLAISAAITHGILAARGGMKAATKASLYGGAMFTLIPAVEYLTSRHASYHNKPTEPQKLPLQTSIPIIMSRDLD